jgi:Type I restriction modification DNA specificity domain
LKAGWTSHPFEEVVADESAGNLKTPQAEMRTAGRYPVVDQGKALVAGYVDDDARLCRTQLPAIVFGDHTRCFKYVDFPFCMGADGTKVLRPRHNANTKYLYHFLRRLPLTNGGYDRHYKYLKRLQVLLPALEEQRRIAEVLDLAEALRAKRLASLAQIDALTQSIFLDLFGDPVTNPKQWQRAELGDAIFSASDGPHVSPSYSESGIPFLSTRHVRGGEIVWHDLKFISRDDAEVHWRKCRPQRGDILYTKGGTTGLAARVQVDVEFAIWVHIALLKPNPARVEPVWLEAMLNGEHCYRQSQKLTRGIANRDLGLKRMVKIGLYLPPLSLQREFAGRIAAVEKLRDAQRASLTELDALFASLQHRAFRGEL